MNAYKALLGSLEQPVWYRTFGGTSEDWAYSVVQTSNGGYAFAGDTLSFGGWDSWLIKTNSTEHEEWNKTHDIANNRDIAWSLIQTYDGGYLLAGQTGSDPSTMNASLIKTGSSGNV